MTSTIARRLLTASTIVALAAVSACGAGDGADTSDGDGSELSGELMVFAAASLTESFTALGEEFTADNPDVDITFNFEGSSTLATQINEGAPADVFASAAPANMETVIEAGNADEDPTTFVQNQLVIAVPTGNPEGISELADLADPELKVAVCAEEVPCGAAANTALEAGDVELTPVTIEKDVKGVMSKLTLGEVDAALVYRTDAQADAEEVEGIEFDESAEAINDYPITVLKDAPNPDAAEAFVELILSDAGQSVLADAGFQTQ